MYEWGQVGRPDGRLWEIRWDRSTGKTSGTFLFKPSKEFRPKEDWQTEREANEGIRFAQRRWPEKAREQETKASFRWAPGAARSPGDIPGLGKNGREITRTEFIVNFFQGKVTFMKRSMTVRNEYMGRMQALWKVFWSGEYPKRIASTAPRIEKEYATIIEKAVAQEILQARMVSKRPLTMPGSPVTVTSKRLPRGKPTTEPRPQVTKKMVERMVNKWRREKNSSTIT
jgi:hypothetical protein